jgi:DinB superfamily
MDVTSLNIETVLSALAEMPSRIASITQHLDRTQLHTKPDAEPWSANDILAHLRSCAHVWGNSIVAMITHDHPTMRYVSPRTWIRKTDYPQQDFHKSLQAFAAQRTELLSLLQPLDREGWSRRATFTGTTKGREQTVFSYAQRIADHEAQHLEQLERMMSARET